MENVLWIVKKKSILLTILYFAQSYTPPCCSQNFLDLESRVYKIRVLTVGLCVWFCGGGAFY